MAGRHRAASTAEWSEVAERDPFSDLTPFGASAVLTCGISQTSINDTGQRLDGTGLLYYHARIYDPALGRFVSADSVVPSLANPQYLNRYSYATNNPLRYTDPTRHRRCVVLGYVFECDSTVHRPPGDPFSEPETFPSLPHTGILSSHADEDGDGIPDELEGGAKDEGGDGVDDAGDEEVVAWGQAWLLASTMAQL